MVGLSVSDAHLVPMPRAHRAAPLLRALADELVAIPKLEPGRVAECEGLVVGVADCTED